MHFLSNCFRGYTEVVELYKLYHTQFNKGYTFSIMQTDTQRLQLQNQRTNGPVNAHLRSAVYTNVIENSPSIGADEALGPFFFRIINILSIQVFPFK